MFFCVFSMLKYVAENNEVLKQSKVKIFQRFFYTFRIAFKGLWKHFSKMKHWEKWHGKLQC